MAAPAPALQPTEVPGERFRDLPSRVRDHAAARPEAVALIDGDARLTSAALADRMDRVAARLRARGVRRGDVVATVAGTTADHVAAYLGALAAGAAVAPLPTTAAPDALERMRRNASPALTLSDRGEAAPEGATDLAALVEEARDAAPLPPEPGGPNALFDVIYSSGTTGDPKGIEHDARFRDRQVSRFARYGLATGATALVSTPIYSNTTLAALLPALGQGTTVVLMRRFREEAFLALAEAHRVTHAMLVPVQIARLLAHPAFERFDLASFEAKLCTSAPLPAAVTAEALARWPGRMVNIYGMTEGGVSAVLDAGRHPDRLHTVGRAVPGAHLLAIDERGRPVPAGVPGEVVGRSPTMMRGYRGDEAATRAATWIDAEGRAWIRSGDMGRLDAEGFLELLDRKRDVIVSGGFNVFATDLEAALLAHPAVAEAAAFAVPSPRWGETPAACVVLRPGAAATGEALRDWANARLGRTQRLSAVAVLPELPRSAIGKVLRRELRGRWPAIAAPRPGG